MRLRLQLDPWTSESEPAVAFTAEPAPAHVDPGVETTRWSRCRSQDLALAPLWFVDGVRRIEARLLAAAAPTPIPGAFASLAAGSVRADGGAIRFGPIAVRRLLILGAGLEASRQIQAGSSTLSFSAWPVSGLEPGLPLDTLQSQMRQEEAALAASLPPDGCLFADGPLTFFSATRQAVVGLVKRIQQPYLAPEFFRLVGELQPGERTPLFLIAGQHNDRYSWYLRLALTRAIEHPLAGIVRLEVSAAAGLEQARWLADLSAAHLPRFASHPNRDPRAPQNLVPIGALEEELKRRLGDAWLIRRAIERRLSEEPSL